MAKKSDLQRRVLIGRKLAMARDMSQLRQEDVALEIFGTPHKNRMSEIENGKLMPDAELLSVLCQKYGVSSDWVLGFTVEPELDKTASVAGILFNSLGDMMSEYTQAMAFQLSMAAAQHVTSFPKALTVQLLTASKQLIQACLSQDQSIQDKVLPELQALMLIVRECEQNRAKQIRNLEMAIDDVFQRDENDLQEKALIDLIQNKKRFSKASLQQQAKLVKDFADVLEQSVSDLNSANKEQINQPKARKPTIEINSHEDLNKIVSSSTPERDEKGRFVSNNNDDQNQSSIRKVAQTITTAIKGVVSNSPQGVDPTVDAINEIGHLLSPVRRAAGLALRPLTGLMRSKKRNEPLPREQENHNRKQLKLLQRIADNLAARGGLLGSLGRILTSALSAGGGLLGGVLGKGKKGIGKLGKGLGKFLKFGRGLPVIGALAAGASLLDWNEQSTQEKGGTVGSLAGGVIGGTVGSIFGPAGTLIGGMAGSWIGNKLGTAVAPYFKEWTDSLIAADVPGIINTAWKGFISYATNAFDQAKGTASKVVEGVKDTAGDTLDFIKDKFNRFNPFHDGVPTWGVGQGVYKPGFGANKNVPAYGATNTKALEMIGSNTVERASSLLRKFEGYNDTAYWDVNAHRVGYGSDTVTDEQGNIRKVTANTKVKKTDAERDLARRTRVFAAEARNKVGEKVWDNLPMDTQAALTSVAYNYGALPKSVVKAVKTGNIEEISNSVRNLQNHNNGINSKRRNAEADIIKGSISKSDNLQKPAEEINKGGSEKFEKISFSNRLDESKKSIKQVLATKPAITPTAQKSDIVKPKLKTQVNTAVQSFKQPLNTPNPQEVVVVNGSSGNISQNVNDRYLAHALTGGIGMGKLDV